MADNEKYNDEGWSSWKRYVIKTLDILQKNQEKMEKRAHEKEVCDVKDITELKTKIKISSSIISIIVALIITILANVFGSVIINNYISPDEDIKIEEVVDKVVDEMESTEDD